MAVQNGQDSVQSRTVEELPSNNAENLDPALLAEQPTSRRMKAPGRCSKCGSFEHNARTCSL